MKKLLFHRQDNLHLIPQNEILYFKSDNCYVEAFLRDKRTFVVVKSLTKFQQEIDNSDFIKVSQSYLVNKNYIDTINKKEKVINLINDDQIPFTMSIKKLLEYL